MVDKKMVCSSIRALRQNYGYTQRDLADIAGLSQSTLSRWEHEQRSPSLAHVSQLCTALGLTPNDLLGIKKPLAQWLREIDEFLGEGMGQRLYDAIVERYQLEDLLDHLRDVEMDEADRLRLEADGFRGRCVART